MAVKITRSGVRISDEFAGNLIIDRDDPALVAVGGSKVRHRRSENSEDAVTWIVFRSLSTTPGS